MRRRAVMAVMLLVGLTSQAQMAEAPPPQRIAPDEASIAALKKRLPGLMEAAEIPGLSVAVIRNGKTYWIRGFGVKNATSRELVRDDTVFEAASLSKPLFAYAVMKLVDEGKLELDRPLSKYLDKPYIADPRIDQITARFVLSHRTGFPNWRPKGGELEIKIKPGERFSYSGEGFVYLATVVEHITGMPLNAFMKNEVFDPLGMTSSSYVWREGYDASAATGHDSAAVPQEKGKPTTANAASSLHTTAGDYAKFVGAVVLGTGLKPKTYREMLTPQIAVDPECTNCTDQPASQHLSKEIFWGLGWGIERTKQREAIWHWGDNGSFRCFVLAYPKQRTGVVMFSNSENGLLIATEVATLAVGGTHPAFQWLKYGTYDSPDFQFQKALQTGTADHAIEMFRQAPSKTPAPSEQAINRAGYQLLSEKRVPEAIEVFRWNVEMYPQSWNVYDSLGEAYMNSGQKQLAIKHYEQSLELNPKNTNAVEMLKKLRQ